MLLTLAWVDFFFLAINHFLHSLSRTQVIGNDLLNLLAYVPADQVRLLLKTAILGAIPEGTDVFKDQLADRIVDQVSEKLYATGAATTPWAKIQTALAGVADAIVREQRQSLVAAVGGLEADQTLAAAGPVNIEATTQAALAAHQATLAARLAEIGQLPDDLALAPVPEGGVAPAVAQDSKAELQRKVRGLADRITGELARRGQVVADVGTDLAPLEADPTLGANIQNTAQADLTRHQAALAALQGRIEALPEDSRGDVPGRLAAVTGRITTELARREAEKTAISEELRQRYENEPLLGEEHIGVSGQNLLGRKQAGLTVLQRRIEALPEDVRGDVPTRLQAVVGRITTEQTRRREQMERLEANLGGLEGLLTRERVPGLAIEDLEGQQATLAFLRQQIESKLPEELRAGPMGRVDALVARVSDELVRKITADIEQLGRTLEPLDNTRVTGREADSYARSLALLRRRVSRLAVALSPAAQASLERMDQKLTNIQRFIRSAAGASRM